MHDGCLRHKRYLIHDRDPLSRWGFEKRSPRLAFRRCASHPSSPNLNAYAERFVRTIKESCLDRMILVGEASLRRAVAEFLDHYHRERNHQGLSNQLIVPLATHSIDDSRILTRERLGGC